MPAASSAMRVRRSSSTGGWMTSFMASQGLEESDKVLSLGRRQRLTAEFFRGVWSLQQFIERSGPAVVQVGTALPQTAQRRRVPAAIRAVVRFQFHIVGMLRRVLRCGVAANAFGRALEECLAALRRR